MVRKQIRGRRQSVSPGLSAALDHLSRKFREALHVADKTYEHLGIPHVLIGGVAVGAYAEPYATKDIDFLVGDEAFDSKGMVISFKPGVPLEACGVPIDSIPIEPEYSEIYEGALKTAVASDEPGIKIVRVDYLATLKLIAGRRRDYDAVVDLLDHGLDQDSVDKIIGGDPELVERFAKAIGLYEEAE